MKKGAQKILLTIFVIAILCSFPFEVYADSSGTSNYNDSYVQPGNNEDKSLVFFPPAPETSYKNYCIFYAPGNERYYIWITNDSPLDLFAGNTFICLVPFVIYEWDNSWNNWEFYGKYNGSSTDWSNYRFPNMQIIDATCPVDGWHVAESAHTQVYYNHTGYKVYWQLSMILKAVLNKLDEVTEFGMQHAIIRFLLLGILAAELILFGVKVLQKIGDMKNEEAA